MRTILFMFLLLAVAAGGFYAYLSTQSNVGRGVARREGDLPPQQLQVDPDSDSVVGASAKPWVKFFDKDRRLQYRFRSGTFAPSSFGRYEVNEPEAEFFQYIRLSRDPNDNRTRTQRIQIVGRHGNVEVQQGPTASADKGFDKGGAASPPKRGLLNDVIIRIFPETTAKKPSITFKAPNVAFDNETFEIATQAYDLPDGTHVEADQVPIEATGDYLFKGRGLVLRWNDIDGRLEMLEIAHGEYLHIPDPKVMSEHSLFGGGAKPDEPRPADASGPSLVEGGPSGVGASGVGAAAGGNLPLTDERGTPVQLAADGPAAATAIAQAKKAKGAGKAAPAKPKRPPQPPYRANFDRNVRVYEGELNVSEREVARANLLQADFLSNSDKPTTQPTTKPATQPGASAGTQPAAENPPGAGPPADGSGPATHPDAGAQKADIPQTQKAVAQTQQAPKPITIRWEGPLHIQPMDSPGEQPADLEPGSVTLRLIGTSDPVLIDQTFEQSGQRVHIDCTSASYNTTHRSARLESSPQHGPVVIHQFPDPEAATRPATRPASQPASPMNDVREATAVTQSLEYDESKGLAYLRGKSQVHVLMAAPATQPATRPAKKASGAADDVVAADPAVAGVDPDAAVAVPESPPPAPALQMVTAAWNKEGVIHFTSQPGQDPVLERADFAGDVYVDHPELNLQSQTLGLLFAQELKHPATQPSTQPLSSEALSTDASGSESKNAEAPGTQPTTSRASRSSTRPAYESVLKEVIATQDVQAQIVGQDGRQYINSQRLSVQTAKDPKGEPYPKMVTANGAVVAWDDKKAIRTENLEMTFAPSTRPATRPSTQPADMPADVKPTGNLPTGVMPTGDEQTSGDRAGGGPAAGGESLPAEASTTATQPSGDGRSSHGMGTANVALQSMRAWGGVDVKSASDDGTSRAVGQALAVRMVDQQPQAQLSGSPVATVTNADGTIVKGPTIRFDSSRQWAKIEGPGSIHALAREKPPATRPAGEVSPANGPKGAAGDLAMSARGGGVSTPQGGVTTSQGGVITAQGGGAKGVAAPATAPTTQPSKPKFVDIVWAKEAEMLGQQNLIRITGPVTVSSQEDNPADQAVHQAYGKRGAVIELTDRPPEPPPGDPSKPGTSSKVAASANPALPGAAPAGAARQPTNASSSVGGPPSQPQAGQPADFTFTKRPRPSPSSLAENSEVPSTRPAGAGDRKSAKAGKGSGSPKPGDDLGNLDWMKNKVVKSVTLDEDVVLNSTTRDKGGILTQFDLRTPKQVQYFVSPQNTAGGVASAMTIGGDSNGKVVVPQEGNLIYRDHRPPTTRPSATPGPAGATGTPGTPGKPGAPATPGEPAAGSGMRGATAFSWKRSLVYDQSIGRAVLDGDVVIVHQEDRRDTLPVRIDTEQAIAFFEKKQPEASTAKKAADKADTTGPSGPSGKASPSGKAPPSGGPAPAAKESAGSFQFRPAQKPPAGTSTATAAAPTNRAVPGKPQAGANAVAGDQPTSHSADAKRDPGANLDLKSLQLVGGVVATRGDKSLRADRADYDPATGWLIAKGSQHSPVSLTDANGQQTSWADEIQWNVNTDMVRTTNLRGRTGTSGSGIGIGGVRR